MNRLRKGTIAIQCRLIVPYQSASPQHTETIELQSGRFEFSEVYTPHPSLRGEDFTKLLQ